MDGPITFLDPTCGSGTFLACALTSGAANVQGWDANQNCVNGALHNLEFVFGRDSANSYGYNVSLRDASIQKRVDDNFEQYDCMVANLPWGQNTVFYYLGLRAPLYQRIPICITRWNDWAIKFSAPRTFLRSILSCPRLRRNEESACAEETTSPKEEIAIVSKQLLLLVDEVHPTNYPLLTFVS